MSARDYGVTTGIGTPVALTAATPRTIAAVIAGAAVSADLVQAAVSFDAAAAAAGIKVELVRYTTDGTGSAYTPTRYNGAAQMMAAVCTAKTAYTVEPTTPTVVEAWFVPNTGGQFWQLPLGRELVIPPSSLLGLRVTSPAAVNVAGNLIFEE